MWDPSLIKIKYSLLAVFMNIKPLLLIIVFFKYRTILIPLFRSFMTFIRAIIGPYTNIN